MDQPRVSVIIPAYNAARFLPEAVDSIRRQGGPRPEIVVVDDGSTDNTAEVVRELGADTVLVRQPNAGPAAARNRGLRTATGNLIAFLDADDVWPDDKLCVQTAYLRAEPGVDLVLGRTRFVDLGRGPGSGTRFDGPDHTFVGAYLGCGLYHRSCFDRVGFFDPSRRFAEDHDWFLRAREAGLVIHVLDAVTLHHRLHGQNMSADLTTANLHLLDALHASIRRRSGRGTSSLAALINRGDSS